MSPTKCIIVAIGFLVINGCGYIDSHSIYRDHIVHKPAVSNSTHLTCTTTPVTQGTQLSCTDGTNILVKNGTNGVDGKNGDPGPQGPQGIPGPQGPEGTQGIQGLPGSTGAAGINGTNGINGINGTNGTNGVQGPEGPQGPQGSSVTTVQLCADDTSTYPEYGIVIGNALYAVYWGSTPVSNGQSQAFLSKIVPGCYISTGGNGCKFSVSTDLSVKSGC